MPRIKAAGIAAIAALGPGAFAQDSRGERSSLRIVIDQRLEQ